MTQQREERALSAGTLLREAREELGWSLRQVADALKIRVEYLEALERNSLEGLPGSAYATGFLKTYANFLHLDTNDIVRRFKAEKSALGRRPELTLPMPMTERSIPGSGLFLIAVILIALGYGTWYYLSPGSHNSVPAVEPVPAQMLNPAPTEPPQSAAANGAVGASASSSATATTASNATPSVPPASTAPPPVETPALADAPSPSGTVAEKPATSETPSPAASNSSTSNSPVPNTALTTRPSAAPTDAHAFGQSNAGRVVVRANASSWVQVKDQGKPIFTRVLAAGETYNVPDKPGLTLRTGNAGGVEISLDGKTQPPIGARGQVKSISLDPAKMTGVSGGDTAVKAPPTDGIIPQ